MGRRAYGPSRPALPFSPPVGRPGAARSTWAW